MSILNTIKQGEEQLPPRLLVYGPEGVGKSTFAAGANSPVFIQTEDGLSQIDAAKFPLATTYDQVIEQLDALALEDHKYLTVVIDSLDWLERLVWDKLCDDYGVKCIEKVDGGYGKGYTHALTYWRKIIAKLAVLRNNGMAIVLVAHSKTEKIADPLASYEYDRHSPRLHKHATGLFGDWVDGIFFAFRENRVSKNEDGKVTAAKVGEGERMLLADGGPGAMAKARWRNFPAELPMNWDAFEDAAFPAAVEEPKAKTTKKGVK